VCVCDGLVRISSDLFRGWFYELGVEGLEKTRIVEKRSTIRFSSSVGRICCSFLEKFPLTSRKIIKNNVRAGPRCFTFNRSDGLGEPTKGGVLDPRRPQHSLLLATSTGTVQPILPVPGPSITAFWAYCEYAVGFPRRYAQFF
jgi:hypothetical protein